MEVINKKEIWIINNLEKLICIQVLKQMKSNNQIKFNQASNSHLTMIWDCMKEVIPTTPTAQSKNCWEQIKTLKKI